MEKICSEAPVKEIGNINTIPTVKFAESEPIVSNKTIVERFANHLLEDGKRLKTVESYTGDAEGFLLFLKQKDVQFQGELKRFQITSYKNHLLENGYEITTINKKINSLQSFNHWLVDEGLTKELVVDLRKDKVRIAGGSEKQVEVLPDKIVDKLLFFVQSEKVSIRNRAIVLTLLYSN